MTKESEIMQFLHESVFDPVLTSDRASQEIQQGVRLTIMRMERLEAEGMMRYFWSAIAGTERSISFAQRMEEEGFTRFEDISQEFSHRFGDDWLFS